MKKVQTTTTKSNSCLYRFSVLIPVYNVEKYLHRCINSILNQSFGNFEIVLIDDGSTDQSSKICDIYQKKDNRIKAYHQVNQGALLARCNAIKLASGEYFIFLDGDDWLRHDALTIINNIIKKENCDVVMYNYYRISKLFKKLEKPLYEDKTLFTGENRYIIQREFLYGTKINTMCMKAINHEIFNDDKDYRQLPRRITKGEDTLQSSHVYKKFKKLIYTSQPLYNYYSNDDGVTGTGIKKSAAYYKDTNLVFEEKFNFMIEMGLANDETIKAFAAHYMHMIGNYALTMAFTNLLEKKVITIYKNMREARIFKKILPLYKKCYLPLYREKRTIYIERFAIILLINKMDKSLYVISKIASKLHKYYRKIKKYLFSLAFE